MNSLLSSPDFSFSESGPAVLGLDLGGANLKVAAVSAVAARSGDDWAMSVPFPLWRQPAQLAQAIRDLVSQRLERFQHVGRWGVTMTGELADCFPDKATGVREIVAAVMAAAGGTAEGEVAVRFWTTDGRWLTAAEVDRQPIAAAAANWQALTTWAARHFAGAFAEEGDAAEGSGWTTGLLVDVGSTTTDLVPFDRNGVRTEARTDLDRLRAGQLVYTGVRRTPLCAVATEVPFRGGMVPVAAELFATTLDVGLLTGRIAEDADSCETADGRPATVVRASDRVVRMLCCDRTEIAPDEIRSLAEFWVAEQRRQIVRALERQRAAGLGRPDLVVLCGEGTWLGQLAVAEWWRRLEDGAAGTYSGSKVRPGPRVVSLSTVIPPACAEAACAWAVACLAAEPEALFRA